MTRHLKDEIAIAAMQAIIAKHPSESWLTSEASDPNSTPNRIARGAYDYADAMIRERSKR
jgi:hypothetical protein